MKKIYLALFFCFALTHGQNPGDIDFTFDYKDHRPRFEGSVHMTATQPDGKIIVIGYGFGMSLYNEKNTGFVTDDKFIVRLNPDMTIDETFQLGLTSWGTVTAVAIQSTGKIILMGHDFFMEEGWDGPGNVIRINPDGSYDETFAQTYIDDVQFQYAEIQMMPDNSIFVASGSNGNVQKVKPNGGIDPAFSGFSTGLVSTFAALPNGKVIYSAPYGGGEVFIGRRNSNGTIDNTFPTIVLDSYVDKFVVQPDGKILVGGKFSSPQARLMRLNADGSIDTGFMSGLTSNGCSVSDICGGICLMVN